MFNKLQKSNKKSVISFFDTIRKVENKGEVKINTLFNIYNQFYSDEKIRRNPVTDIDVDCRRRSLEAIFANRAKFLIDNVIKSYYKYFYFTIDDLSSNYPFLFDLHAYMAMSYNSIIDFANVICSDIYTKLTTYYYNADEFIYNHTDIIKNMHELEMELVETLIRLMEEAKNIYYPAGINYIEE